MRNRKPAARVGALILLAVINLQGVLSSPRWEQIRAVDALRLVGGGMLIGAALAILVQYLRTQMQESAQ